MVRWELFCNLPESTGKHLPCKEMPSRDNLKKQKTKNKTLSGQRADPSILQELRFPTDSSKLNGCGSKLDTSSLSSLPLLLSLAHPATAARTRTPRPPPSHPPGSCGGQSPTRPGSRCRDKPASHELRARFPGRPGELPARPTHLCLLHKERQRCDPVQAAVWRLRLDVLELQHIARAAAADSPRIG